MSANDKPPQQRRASKKPELVPLPLANVDVQKSEAVTDEDLYFEGDPLETEPPRSNFGSNRLNHPAQRRRDSSSQTTQNVPLVRRTGQGISPMPNTTSARPVRATTQQPPWNRTASRDLAQKKQNRNVHWLLYVGIGMIAALTLWVAASTVLAWGTERYNDMIYGYPRTFQTDAVVGHGGDSPSQPSHFIAMNLHGQIIVIELMAGNPAKSINYTGPDLFEQGGDRIPVTLEFRDVTGDGKPDMLIHIQNRAFVFVNDGTKFRPSNNSDKIKQ